MADPREEKFKQIVAQFPDSPMGHFSLGKLYLEQRRFAEAIVPLENATRLDVSYAAALVSLGDAYAGAAKSAEAKATYEKAKAVALSQKHDGLAEDIDAKLSDL